MGMQLVHCAMVFASNVPLLRFGIDWAFTCFCILIHIFYLQDMQNWHREHAILAKGKDRRRTDGESMASHEQHTNPQRGISVHALLSFKQRRDHCAALNILLGITLFAWLI